MISNHYTRVIGNQLFNLDSRQLIHPFHLFMISDNILFMKNILFIRILGTDIFSF